MKLIYIASIFTFFLHFYAFGQGMTEQQKQIVELLDSKKSEFQHTSNDSIYITKNSDSPYRYIYLRRGDEPEDIEEEIYNAKPGQVVGPFRSGNHNYLFKIVNLDSTRYRFKVRHIFIKPAGFEIKDTVEAFNKAVKLAKSLNKDEDFKTLYDQNNSDFKKVASECGIISESVSADGDLGWIWEGVTINPINAALIKTRKGEAVAVKTNYGSHVFKIVTKETGFYKAIIISLLKKVNK